MIDTLVYNKNEYPLFQSQGFAAEFAFPYASKVCKGFGYDVGCMKREWAFPGSYPIDLSFDDEFHALNLPKNEVDYIFSSHCLEHIPDWVEVLNYWTNVIKKDGVIFLYLPDYSQEYWRPWNNRKHFHIFNSKILMDYFESKNYNKIFASGVDLNNSFMIMAQK